MSDTVDNWLRDGEALHDKLMSEYTSLELELHELESKMLAKGLEVDRLAQLLGKPKTGGATKRVSAELITPDDPNAVYNDASNSGVRARPPRMVPPTGAKFATERVVATPAVTRMLSSIPGRHAE